MANIYGVHEEEARRFRLELMALHRRLRAEHVQDVPLSELLVLGSVDRLGDRVAPGLLADDLKMARSNVSTVLRHLESNGWVTTEASTEDARRRVVQLTGSGRDILARDRVSREAWLQAATDTLTPEEQAVLIRAGELMQQLADAPQT